MLNYHPSVAIAIAIHSGVPINHRFTTLIDCQYLLVRIENRTNCSFLFKTVCDKNKITEIKHMSYDLFCYSSNLFLIAFSSQLPIYSVCIFLYLFSVCQNSLTHVQNPKLTLRCGLKHLFHFK